MVISETKIWGSRPGLLNLPSVAAPEYSSRCGDPQPWNYFCCNFPSIILLVMTKYLMWPLRTIDLEVQLDLTRIEQKTRKFRACKKVCVHKEGRTKEVFWWMFKYRQIRLKRQSTCLASLITWVWSLEAIQVYKERTNSPSCPDLHLCVMEGISTLAHKNIFLKGIKSCRGWCTPKSQYLVGRDRQISEFNALYQWF